MSLSSQELGSSDDIELRVSTKRAMAGIPITFQPPAVSITDQETHAPKRAKIIGYRGFGESDPNAVVSILYDGSGAPKTMLVNDLEAHIGRKLRIIFDDTEPGF